MDKRAMSAPRPNEMIRSELLDGVIRPMPSSWKVEEDWHD